MERRQAECVERRQAECVESRQTECVERRQAECVERRQADILAGMAKGDKNTQGRNKMLIFTLLFKKRTLLPLQKGRYMSKILYKNVHIVLPCEFYDFI